ncbi:hypothetical protein [Paenibacillus sp. NPDC058174]|uniref:hypothetical protein n=1 Tax=Paenibacillus sp. NPDC058174 TaxID=3346366 RepID=UPI0036D9C65F
MTDNELVDIIHNANQNLLDFNILFSKNENLDKSIYVIVINSHLEGIVKKCKAIQQEIIDTRRTGRRKYKINLSFFIRKKDKPETTSN